MYRAAEDSLRPWLKMWNGSRMKLLILGVTQKIFKSVEKVLEVRVQVRI